MHWAFPHPFSLARLYCVTQYIWDGNVGSKEKRKACTLSPPPLLLRLCLPIPPPSYGHADRYSHRLSGSVMTCCRRSLWGRQECWCFRLALKGVECVLPLLLQPLVPTAPFSAHVGTVCLYVSLFLLLPVSLYILHSLINVIHWGKAFSLCLSLFPAALLTAQHL